MWNNNFDDDNDEDESWEVRAFKEDTTRLNLLGCIWPPPSYTCTFCWKEFRSAQALGGHMNVHRRDRAKLNVSKVTIPLSNPNLNTGNCLCLIYTAPNPSDETLISPTCTGAMEQFHGIDINECDNYEISGNEPCLEELDLELRLGPKSSPSPMRREAHV